jgi:hypothetical protein
MHDLREHFGVDFEIPKGNADSVRQIAAKHGPVIFSRTNERARSQVS